MLEKNLFIFGCSGVGKSIIDSITRTKLTSYKKIIFVDINTDYKDKSFYGCPIVMQSELTYSDTHGHDAIFAFYKPEDILDRRDEIIVITNRLNLNLVTIIDPTAVISPTAQIGVGCYIAPCVVLDSDSKISDNSIILFHTIISREVQISASCFISASCTIKGGVRIHKSCYIGANSSIVKDIFEPVFVNAMTFVNREIIVPSIIYNKQDLIDIKTSENEQRTKKLLKRLNG